MSEDDITAFEIDEVIDNFGTFQFLDLRSLSTRELPQEMKVANYTGILTPKFFVEAQYSERETTFIGGGAPTGPVPERR